MEAWKRVLFPAASLFMLFMLDGVIATFFNETLYINIGYVVPRLAVILLIVFSFYLKPGHLFILSLLLGYFYDSYYTGILGPYMAVFCLITYLVYQMKVFLKPGMLTYALVGTLMFAVLEIMIYSVYTAIGLTSVSFIGFLTGRFAATLFLNVVILVLASPLLDKFSLFIVSEKKTAY